MSIVLETGGRRYDNWTSARVERSLDTISGSFEFEAIADSVDSFPIPRGQSVRVYVNNVAVMTGFVDRIGVSYSANEHRITIRGRDKTADIVDSHIDETMEFKAPITIDEVIKRVLSNLELNDTKVINLVKDLEPFKKEELVSGKIGEKAFEFIDKYACKRQVVLTTDGLGNVVVTRASDKLLNVVLRNEHSHPFNTIKTAQVEYDDSERYNKYKFVTQANHSAEPDMTDAPTKSTNRNAEYTDSEIRTSRKYVAVAEGNSKEKAVGDRAKWEANLRKAKSAKYNCLHVGHSPYSWDGEPYQPNSLVSVKDEFADIDDKLLIVKTIHTLSSSDGSTTELHLLTREAFMILLQEKDKSETEDSKSKGGGKTKGKGESSFVKVDNSASDYFKNYKEK